jgi:hypothetical protein
MIGGFMFARSLGVASLGLFGAAGKQFSSNAPRYIAETLFTAGNIAGQAYVQTHSEKFGLQTPNKPTAMKRK